MAVLNDDVNQLERFLDMGANEVILTTSNVVFVGIAFFLISPEIALLAFVPDPGDHRWGRCATSARSRSATTPCGPRRAASPTRSPTTSAASATIKAFTAEAREVERVAVDSRAYSDANGEAIRYSAAFIPLIRMAILAGFTMTLAGGRTSGAQRRPRDRLCTRRSCT